VRRLAAAALAGTALAAGCGEEDEPLPAACTEGSRAVARALAAAPRAVELADGTSISTCVNRARSDAELQTVGAVLTPVAQALAEQAPRSDRAALELGYLVGAARSGARDTSGIHVELVRRLEQAAGTEGPPPHRRPAFDRGLAAGERSG
jgi:hypothetical protein